MKDIASLAQETGSDFGFVRRRIRLARGVLSFIRRTLVALR